MTREVRVYSCMPGLFEVYFYTDIGSSAIYEKQAIVPERELLKVAKDWIVDKLDQVPLENPSMNLIGQWNKDKTQCWQIAAAHMFQSTDLPKYRAECWSNTPSDPNGYNLTHTMPWRDTMEEAQKDIPHDETKP